MATGPAALFVGGGTGGGKTTLARTLAVRHRLRALHVDCFWYAHAARAGETPPPPDVQWLEWTPETQARDFERVSRIMLRFVLDDLPLLAAQPTVIVEGPQVLPDLIPRSADAVFLNPAPGFQRRVLAPRPMPSSDPARALAARLVKDRLYADRVAALARERGFRVLEVDGSRRADELAAEVEAAFADALAASEPRELAAVSRWENENLAGNLAAWVASEDADPGAPSTFAFACECGRLGCGERVELALEQFRRTARVLAIGHGL